MILPVGPQALSASDYKGTRLSDIIQDVDIGGQLPKRQEFNDAQMHSGVGPSSFNPPTAPEILPQPEGPMSQISFAASQMDAYISSYQQPDLHALRTSRVNKRRGRSARKRSVCAVVTQGASHHLRDRQSIGSPSRADSSTEPIGPTEKQDELLPNDLNATNEEKAKAREQVQALLAKWTTLGTKLIT